jgi:AraC-like DNA-binding protein
MLNNTKDTQKNFYNIFFPEKSLKLHSMLNSCGYEYVTSTSYRWDGLRRGNKDFCFWQYTLSGRGTLRFDDEQYELHPGDAMLLTVPENHLYFFPPDSDHWEFIFVTMHGSEIMRLFRDLRKYTGPVVSFKDDSETVKMAWDIIESSKTSTITSKYESSAIAYSFIMSMLDYIKPVESGAGGRPEFIDKVYDYCMKNIDQQITVDDLAQIAGYSRFHFSRLFRQYEGMAPMNFLNELRVKMAIRLLQAEKLSVKETAQRCGFEDVSYFCKVFRKYQKISPGGFRDAQE